MTVALVPLLPRKVSASAGLAASGRFVIEAVIEKTIPDFGTSPKQAFKKTHGITSWIFRNC